MGRRAAPLIILALIALILPAACQEPGASFETALPVDLIPGEVQVPESGGYVLNSTSQRHYFELRGLQAGQRLEIELEVTGIEQGRAAVAIYKETGELIAQKRIQYGSGTRESIAMAYQPGLESAAPGSTHYLALIWYSGSMSYRLTLALEPVEDYSPGSGDAGSSPDAAIRLPDLEPGEMLEARGYLASIDDGGDAADHVDYYLIGARFNSSRSALRIQVDPIGEMRIAASVYRDGYRLAYGSSGEPGGEVSLEVPGDWEPGESYEFALRVDNLADRSGGAYLIRAWIEEPNATGGQQAPIQPPEGPGGQLLELMVIAGAAALIAISIAMLILRRRRIYRVEEVGWWGY